MNGERSNDMTTKYTEAHARGNAEYEARTFKKHLFRFRLDSDQDMLESIEDAKAHGISKNEWLREMFDGKGVSLAKVRKVLEKYDVDPRIADKIIKELQ